MGFVGYGNDHFMLERTKFNKHLRLLFVQRSYPEIFFKLLETTACDEISQNSKFKKISPLKNLVNF